MAKRLAVSTLNASTIDILNVIRQNASYEYQQQVPVVERASDIPKVGEVIYGQPALANQFLNALVNRIALVRVNSATFNNPYVALKKGYLEFGETIEEIFVSIAKVVDYNPEKAKVREFQRNLPDVRSAFHTINWRVMYPVTVQDNDLKQAFLSINGVEDLIARIVDSVYTAAANDEYLLFKYMLIKAISSGKFAPVSVNTTSGLSVAATKFRGISNILPFMSRNYNESGVSNTTPRDRQVIFMDAMFNARFDVEVLAGAFNMDKTEFLGKLYLIDNWAEFDDTRFKTIMAASDGLEAVTPAELSIMSDVRAAIVDVEWFQIYDNLSKFTEKYVASGPYWNYFYHVWKTISHSPFANAVVFIEEKAENAIEALTASVVKKEVSNDATVIGLNITSPENLPQRLSFVQTAALAQAGVGVQPYGAILIPKGFNSTSVVMEISADGNLYTSSSVNLLALEVGSEINFTE